MNNIEEILTAEKKKIANLQVPDELEHRLKNRLYAKKKPKRNLGMIAAILIGFLFFSYNFDAIAYYGKKILGYDEIMNGAIQDLNEMGQGQGINKSYQFNNGAVITLDGIMLDENRLIAFYTLKVTEGKVNDYSLFPMSFQGISRYYHQGGQGKSNLEFTEVKWVSDFEPPRFYERGISFEFNLSGPGNYQENGSIEFKLDRSKAMGYTIKQKIDRSFAVKDTKVNFKTIKASPTQTVIEGSINTALEYIKNVIHKQYYRYNIDFDLLANGQKLQKQGGGLSTSEKGITFEGRFDPLPQELDTLAINLTGLTISEPVDESIRLSAEENPKKITIAGNEILFEKMYTKGNNTYVTINTEDHVLLEKVYLMVDGNQIALEKTIQGDEEKHKDGKITYRRTLEFLGTGEKVNFLVKRISYQKQYDEIIEIPLR